jgi:cell division septation protein DedD
MPQFKKKINLPLDSIASVNAEGTWMLKNSIENDMVQRLGQGATSEEGGDYTEFTFYPNPDDAEEGESKVTATVELGRPDEMSDEGEDDDTPAVHGDTQAAVDKLHSVLVAANNAQSQGAGRKKKSRKTKKSKKSKKSKKMTRRR